MKCQALFSVKKRNKKRKTKAYCHVLLFNFKTREQILSFRVDPFQKGIRSKFFPFRVDPFSERFWLAGKQTGSLKDCLHCKKKMAKHVSCVSSPYKRLCLIHLCRMDYSTLILWTGPFPVKGVPG